MSRIYSKSVSVSVRHIKGIGFVGIIKNGWQTFSTHIFKFAREAYSKSLDIVKTISGKTMTFVERVIVRGGMYIYPKTVAPKNISPIIMAMG